MLKIEDVVPKDTSTLQLSAEAPEPPATAQPCETMPVVAPAGNSTFDKVMVKLKNSLEDRKNAKNQAEKAVSDGPKALAKAKAKAKTSKNSKGPKPKPASHKAVKPKPKAGKPKAVKTMADKPKASKPKAELCREIPASLKRKFAEGCSRLAVVLVVSGCPVVGGSFQMLPKMADGRSKIDFDYTTPPQKKMNFHLYYLNYSYLI